MAKKIKPVKAQPAKGYGFFNKDGEFIVAYPGMTRKEAIEYLWAAKHSLISGLLPSRVAATAASPSSSHL